MKFWCCLVIYIGAIILDFSVFLLEVGKTYSFVLKDTCCLEHVRIVCLCIVVSEFREIMSCFESIKQIQMHRRIFSCAVQPSYGHITTRHSSVQGCFYHQTLPATGTILNDMDSMTAKKALKTNDQQCFFIHYADSNSL